MTEKERFLEFIRNVQAASTQLFLWQVIQENVELLQEIYEHLDDTME